MINVNATLPIRAILIIFCCVFCITGCQVKTEQRNFSFVGEHEYAIERILLLDDNSFIHKVYLKKSGKIVIKEGTWKYRTSTQDIVFDKNYMSVVDGHGIFNSLFDHENKYITSLPIRKLFRKITLGNSEVILYKMDIDGSEVIKLAKELRGVPRNDKGD